MIDWNGDGKIDPVEVGATMVFLDDDETPVKKKQPSGCFAACLAVLAVFLCVVWSVYF